MYNEIPFLILSKVWDAPGSLPDHSGWILKQTFEVGKNCQTHAK